MKGTIHIKLSNSQDMRSGILKSAMMFTEELQSYISLKKLRIEKRKKMDDAKKLINEIKQLSESVNIEDVPGYEISENGLEKVEVEEVKTRKARKEVLSHVKSKEESILDGREEELARELMEIERKLNSIR